MNNSDEKAIIDRYRNSDFDARLFLFLDHRSLRSKFSAIDMADSKQHREEKKDKRQPGFFIGKLWNPIKRLLPEISFG